MKNKSLRLWLVPTMLRKGKKDIVCLTWSVRAVIV